MATSSLGPEQPAVFRKSVIAQSVSAALLTSVSGSAVAQQIEEVIVTATKRAENIQDVPLAITAFTGDFVKEVNLDDVNDLVTFSPGVSGNSKDAFIDAISIRGVRTQDFGTGGDPSAAFFKNELYEGRNGAVVTSLYDLERAEVLRGPQGLLFGRNAVGGAFSVHTKRPTLGGARDGYVDRDGSVYRPSTQSPRLDVWEAILGPVNVPSDPRDFNSDQFAGTDDTADILTLGLHVDYDFGTFSLDPAIFMWFADGADAPLTAADGYRPA